MKNSRLAMPIVVAKTNNSAVLAVAQSFILTTNVQIEFIMLRVRTLAVALSRVEFCKARDPITYYAKS